jgi:hypothetical protein
MLMAFSSHLNERKHAFISRLNSCSSRVPSAFRSAIFSARPQNCFSRCCATTQQQHRHTP